MLCGYLFVMKPFQTLLRQSTQKRGRTSNKREGPTFIKKEEELVHYFYHILIENVGKIPSLVI
jgi:hypothetical protein